ncbi:hypothetical protein PMIN04_008779, partial [Paraphaeosphaeria minitans]
MSSKDPATPQNPTPTQNREDEDCEDKVPESEHKSTVDATNTGKPMANVSEKLPKKRYGGETQKERIEVETNKKQEQEGSSQRTHVAALAVPNADITEEDAESRRQSSLHLLGDLQREQSKNLYREDHDLTRAKQNQPDDEPGGKADDTPEDTLAVKPEEKPEYESQKGAQGTPRKSTEGLPGLVPGNSRNTPEDQIASALTESIGEDTDDGERYVGDLHEHQADKTLDGKILKFRGQNPNRSDFAKDEEWEEATLARKVAQKLRKQATVAQMSEEDQMRHKQEKTVRNQRRKENRKRDKETNERMGNQESFDQESSGAMPGEPNKSVAEEGVGIGIELTITQPEELLKKNNEDQSNDRPHAEHEDTPEDQLKEMPGKKPEDHPVPPSEKFYATETHSTFNGGTTDDVDGDRRHGEGTEDLEKRKVRPARLRKRDFEKDAEWQYHKLAQVLQKEYKKSQMSEEERIRSAQKEADQKRKKKERQLAKKVQKRIEAAGLSAEIPSEQLGDAKAAEGDDDEEPDLIEQTVPIEKTRPIDETRLDDGTKPGDQT